MNVTAVEPKPGGDAGFVLFDDGSKAWTPERVKAEPLVGKPVPGDWTLKDGPYGKQLLPPKEAGGKTAWRNTKEGFLAEQDGRIRWQLVEEERRDRRTALMQAVQYTTTRSGGGWDPSCMQAADVFYNWLTKSGGERRVETIAYGEGVIGSKAPPPDSTSAPRQMARDSRGVAPDAKEGVRVAVDTAAADGVGADESAGVGSGPDGGSESPANHLHGPWSDKRPDGKPMRDGWLRCEGCGQASLRKSVA